MYYFMKKEQERKEAEEKEWEAFLNDNEEDDNDFLFDDFDEDYDCEY